MCSPLDYNDEEGINTLLKDGLLNDDFIINNVFLEDIFADEIIMPYLDNISPMNNDNISTKQMDNWKPIEVVDFILHEVPVDPESIVKFNSVSGYIFRTLSEDFCKSLVNSNELGEIIYRVKENHIRETSSSSDENFHHFHPTSPGVFPVENLGYRDDSTHFQNNNNHNRGEIIKKAVKKAEKQKNGRLNSTDKIGKNKRRSEKLWEFLLHLLQDASTCPRLIKWEDFAEGTFKFVQSDKVARLWGSRKKNENMTYEKFSRAMRYYYKSKILLPVPGKRLVYKFGPHAKGWTEIAPSCS